MVLGEVKKTFNPEFINRVDEIIVFDPLSDDDLRRMGLLIGNLNQHLTDRQLKIEALPEVIDWIIDATCRSVVWRASAASGAAALHRGPALRRAHPR